MLNLKLSFCVINSQVAINEPIFRLYFTKETQYCTMTILNLALSDTNRPRRTSVVDHIMVLPFCLVNLLYR
jgi:hypothetical protein